MHRLVQDFARRAMTKDRRNEALRQALAWVNAAFVGDPQDVRSWPVLDPLAPHALAVARRADEAGVEEPTGRLLGQLSLLFGEKARFVQAEPLYRRAVMIFDKSLGPDHPNVATSLNSLAHLLQDTYRPSEAEPLYRRALAISEKSLGPDHPNVATSLNSLAQLLQDTYRPDEAEPLYRRALAISEKSLGPDHPNVAIRLTSLAKLLLETQRLSEAEPLYRRALAICEKSLGPEHPNTAVVRRNLGALEAGRRAEAVAGPTPVKAFLRRLLGKR
jgi:tetratricopeptide (TPR) repeat protein